MDTRGEPDPGDRGNTSLGVTSHTASAETVELEAVGAAPSRRVPAPQIVALTAVAALVGYVTGIATASPKPPASDAPAVAAASSGTSQLPATPTPAAPTEPSTIGPPSAWVRADLPADDHLGVVDVWGVGERVLALAEWNGWTFLSIAARRAWQVSPPPRAIDTYWGGAVVDGRLWFVGRVTGVTPDDVTSQLVGTSDGESWESLGSSPDLARFDYVPFLSRIDRIWVAAAWQYTDGAAEGAGLSTLHWSRDGVEWQEARLPQLPGPVTYHAAGSTGDTMMVLATAVSDDAPEFMILTSTDGITWRRSPFPDTLVIPNGLACRPSACVLTGVRIEQTGMPVVWLSRDGRDWTESESRIPSERPGNALEQVVPTEAGFLGIEGGSHVVWASSPDARKWRSVAVLPTEPERSIVGLASSGDLVVALDGAADGAKTGAWRASLAAMVGG